MTRWAVPLGLTAIVAAASLVALGPPDWVGARDFFLSGQPTVASAAGASKLTLSALALALFGWALARTVRAAARRVGGWRRRTVVGALTLLAGLLVLAAGVGHHLSAQTVVLDGGSLKEANQLLAR
jgi:hypothetical protein